MLNVDILPSYMEDLKRLIRFFNSGTNAFLYAATREVYRRSFKCLLTTSPWKWGHMLKMSISKINEESNPGTTAQPSGTRIGKSLYRDQMEITTQIEEKGSSAVDSEQPTDRNAEDFVSSQRSVSFVSSAQRQRGRSFSLSPIKWYICPDIE